MEDARAWSWTSAAVEAVSGRSPKAQEEKPDEDLERLCWQELHAYGLRATEAYAEAERNARKVAETDPLPRWPLRDGEVDPRARAWATVAVYRGLRENHDGMALAFNEALARSLTLHYCHVLLEALSFLLAAGGQARTEKWISAAEERLPFVTDPETQTALRTELLMFRGAVQDRLGGALAGTAALREAYAMAESLAPQLILATRARLAAALLRESPQDACALLELPVPDAAPPDALRELDLLRAGVLLDGRDLHAAMVVCERMIRALPNDLPPWPARLRDVERVLEVAARTLEAQGDAHATSCSRDALERVRALRACLRSETSAGCEHLAGATARATGDLKRLIAARASGRIETSRFIVYTAERRLEFRETGRTVQLEAWFVAILERIARGPFDSMYRGRSLVSSEALRSMMSAHGVAVSRTRFRRVIMDSKQDAGLTSEDLFVGLPHPPGGYYLED